MDTSLTSQLLALETPGKTLTIRELDDFAEQLTQFFSELLSPAATTN